MQDWKILDQTAGPENRQDPTKSNHARSCRFYSRAIRSVILPVLYFPEQHEVTAVSSVTAILSTADTLSRYKLYSAESIQYLMI